ncbi:uncharacterized protein LOC117129295 [Brassica rapa]|uniref:uncharacterized protein LOC117129295 n=1 Tax=Brassica campestris TaxID=3711 RepID=UPI00142D678D|nr:uncharacterized protein LOC117129295 [Brassica rapa]
MEVYINDMLVKSLTANNHIKHLTTCFESLNNVLVREDRGEQRPIFYTSKVLDNAETRYSPLKKLAYAVVVAARKLRPYFQSHTIHAVELSEYDVEFKSKTCAKSQVLADFLTELPPSQYDDDLNTKNWCLYVDGSSSRNGSGVGIRLISPTSEIIEQSFRLAFPASNNEAEYEALIAGLRLAKAVGVNKIETFCDSQLVANQFSSEYETRNDRMNAYLQVVQKLSQDFTNFTLTKIPRSDNSSADALAALASTSDPLLRRMIPVESIDKPSIELVMGVNIIDDLDEEMDDTNEMNEPTPEKEVEDLIDWRDEIKLYITEETTPDNRWAARRLKARCAHYVMNDNVLFKWSSTKALLRCIHGQEVRWVLEETHEGAGGNHSGGRALAIKIK